MSAGLNVFLAILGIVLGGGFASLLVFYLVKNQATIVGGQLISKDLSETVFLAFAVRINKTTDIMYRTPQNFNEASKAFFHPHFWQKNHQREIIGKPIRIGTFKIDDKLIPYLHYSFKKITIVEDCIDSKILHAFSEPALGLAIEGAVEETQISKKKKSSDKIEIKSEEEIFLRFVKDSVEDLQKQLISEREKRIFYKEQLIPTAQMMAGKALGIDIDKIMKSLKLPTFDELLQQITDDSTNEDNKKNWEKAKEKFKEEVLKDDSGK